MLLMLLGCLMFSVAVSDREPKRRGSNDLGIVDLYNLVHNIDNKYTAKMQTMQSRFETKLVEEAKKREELEKELKQIKEYTGDLSTINNFTSALNESLTITKDYVAANTRALSSTKNDVAANTRALSSTKNDVAANTRALSSTKNDVAANTRALSSTKNDVAANTRTLSGFIHRRSGIVYVKGRPVCDDLFDTLDAVVACRMRGYDNVISYKTGQSIGRTDFIMRDLQCTGTESSLWDCKHYVYTSGCNQFEGIYLECN